MAWAYVIQCFIKLTGLLKFSLSMVQFFLSFFLLLVWQFKVMNFKQAKIEFKPQIKMNNYIASVNPTCTLHPPGFRGGGHLTTLSVQGVGHLQILHCHGPGHLPTPGAIPELLTRMRFPIRI